MDYTLHLRDDLKPQEPSSLSKLSLSDYPHFQLASEKSHWSASLEFAKKIKKDFDHLVVVGIGGSCLGGKTLCHYFSPFNSVVDFWDSADESFLKAKFQRISDLSKTHFIVVSKSGSTMETIEGRDFVLKKLEEKQLDYKKHMSVITEDKPSKLFDWGKEHSLNFLAHPLEIGGRFSALTEVGLTPLAFLLGDDFQAEFEKASSWKHNTSLDDMCAEYLRSWEREEYVSVFWPYDEELRYVGDWIQQLWAESLGKKIKKDGSPAPKASSPVALHGSKDQHSVLQQVAEGQKDKFLSFFHVKEVAKSERSLIEVMKSQTPVSLQNQVNHCILSFDNIWDVLLSFEYFIIRMGEEMGIDVFDQPGVEASKKLFKKKIAEFEANA